ncbi:MAG: hypothetical protein AB7Q17_12380 [Phycisphaerae bacterium]
MSAHTMIPLAALKMNETPRWAGTGCPERLALARVECRAALVADGAHDALRSLRDKLDEALTRLAAAATLKEARLALSWLRRLSTWDDIQAAIEALDAYAAAVETFDAELAADGADGRCRLSSNPNDAQSK